MDLAWLSSDIEEILCIEPSVWVSIRDIHVGSVLLCGTADRLTYQRTVKAIDCIESVTCMVLDDSSTLVYYYGEWIYSKGQLRILFLM